jgi:transposase
VTIGCDLGDRKSDLCLLDEDGEVVERAELASTSPAFRRYFAGRDASTVVIEVSAHARWVKELLEQLGHRVVVADPRQLKWVTHSNRKNDRVDAEKLARLGRSDLRLLNPVKLRSTELHLDLAVINSRNALVECRTRLINHVRGVAKALDHRVPKCGADQFHKRATAFPPELLRALQPVLSMIESLTEEIAELDEAIEALGETKYPQTKRLRQVKGVGPIVALAYVLTLGDPTRFRDSRSVAAYLGLVPRQRQSGARDPEMRISKAGNPYLRQLLVQSAQYILGRFGPDTDLRRFGLRLAERGGKAAKKRAIIAVARKLAVLLHRLWVSGDKYVPCGFAAAPLTATKAA